MRARPILILAAIIFTGSFLLNWFFEGERSVLQPNFNPSTSSLLASGSGEEERVWPQIHFEPVKGFAEKGPLLYGSLNVKWDPWEGDLLVVDFGEMAVHRFSGEGVHRQTYGKGRGQGPGELSMVTDVAGTRDGGVLVADHSNGRLLEFTADGHVSETRRLEIAPYRVASDPDGNSFFLRVGGTPQLFSPLEESSGTNSAFGEFLEDQAVNGLLLDGWIEGHPSGGLVYAGLYASMLASFDAGGDLRYLRPTIADLPLPALERNSQGQMWVERTAPYAAVGLNVDRDHIYVPTTVETGLRRKGAVDIYALESGDYLYSMWLPEKCERAVVTASAIYTVKDAEIRKWSWQLSDIAESGSRR